MSRRGDNAHGGGHRYATEKRVLDKFPKHRPELPPPYQKVYADAYRKNREGQTTASSLAQRMEQWMHRRVAADCRAGAPPRSTLEIGAGTLNHLRFEPGTTPYDIVEPFTSLYEYSSRLARIRMIYTDIGQIPTDGCYDRIVSIAAFEHIVDLPAVVARSGILLAPGGRLRVAIPSEGELLWKVGWMCTTGLEFRRQYGLDYGVIMHHEHVNTACDVVAVLRYFFSSVKRRLFGPIAALSFYQYLECSAPISATCNDYLEAHTDSVTD